MAFEDILASNLGREEPRHAGPGTRRQPTRDAARDGEAHGQKDLVSPRSQDFRCGPVRRRAVPGLLGSLRLPARSDVLFASLRGYEVVHCTGGFGQERRDTAPTRDRRGCQGGPLCWQACRFQKTPRFGSGRRIAENRRIRGLYSHRRVRPTRSGVGGRGDGFGRKLAPAGFLQPNGNARGLRGGRCSCIAVFRPGDLGSRRERGPSLRSAGHSV